MVRVAKRSRTTALFDPVKTAANMSNRVLVGISGGKDSVVTLDLCLRFFKHVSGFFMYIVPGLSFQENILTYYEKRYGIEILRMPHFMVSDFYRWGVYRHEDLKVKTVSTVESYNFAREQAETWWIAGGERISDSIIRRAMIKASGSIDKKRGRFFPLAYWNKQDVLDYIKIHKLKVGEESEKLGFSFRSLNGSELAIIKDFYPKDYERIKRYFPLVDAAIMHYKNDLQKVNPDGE